MNLPGTALHPLSGNIQKLCKYATILYILQPFVHHTNITGAENSTTIAMVIPVLKKLYLHLEEMSKTNELHRCSFQENAFLVIYICYQS